MKIRGMIGETRTGEVTVSLFEGEGEDRPVLKAYLSPDHRVVRLVLPEFSSFLQTRLDIDKHLIDFERSATEAKRHARSFD